MEDDFTFTCPVCEEQFLDEKEFSSHLAQAHPESSLAQKLIAEQGFGCSLCSFKAKSESTVRNHIRDAHRDQHIYQCKGCTFQSRTLNGITMHLRAMKDDAHYDRATKEIEGGSASSLRSTVGYTLLLDTAPNSALFSKSLPSPFSNLKMADGLTPQPGWLQLKPECSRLIPMTANYPNYCLGLMANTHGCVVYYGFACEPMRMSPRHILTNMEPSIDCADACRIQMADQFVLAFGCKGGRIMWGARQVPDIDYESAESEDHLVDAKFLTATTVHGNDLHSISLDAGTASLICGTVDGYVAVCDLEGRLKSKFRDPNSMAAVLKTVVHPCSPSLMVSVCGDRTLRFWDTRSVGLMFSVKCSGYPMMNSLLFDPQNTFQLYTSGGDMVHRWEMRQRLNNAHQTVIRNLSARHLQMSPRNRLLLLTGEDNVFVLWPDALKVTNQLNLENCDTSGDKLVCSSFSENGREISAMLDTGEIIVFSYDSL